MNGDDSTDPSSTSGRGPTWRMRSPPDHAPAPTTLAPSDATRPTDPGMNGPAPSPSTNRAFDSDRSASSAIQRHGIQRAFSSTPRLRLARLGSVVPASPTKTSSESISSTQAATDATNAGDGAQRAPSS